MKPVRPPVQPPRGAPHLALLLILSACFGIAAWRVYLQAEQIFHEELHKQFTGLSSAKINEFNSWIHERRGDAQVASHNAAIIPGLQAALAQRSPVRELVLRWMQGIRSSYRYNSIVALDPSGAVRLTAGPPLSDANTYKALAHDAADRNDELLRYLPQSGGSRRSYIAICSALRA
ncbi:MAG TPA: hypothetical protein VHA14_11255, partial [Bryobacteraceae bacterium]|nr:hypothetical protein [Bryobacteraceae bacterium]